MLHTIVRVLPRNLRNAVTGLLPDFSKGLAGQAIHQFLPDNQSLFRFEG